MTDSAPKRIQRKRTKGWKMPEGAVYVGRPSEWGNPYRVGGIVIRQGRTSSDMTAIEQRSTPVLKFRSVSNMCPRPSVAPLKTSQAVYVINEFLEIISFGISCLINPQITKLDGEQIADEGCLSMPGARTAKRRFETVTVRARNEKGKSFTLTGTGLLARAMQHEIDHLNGVLLEIP